MRICLLTCFIFLAVKSYGQDTILLKNPSFEDVPKCCAPPEGWINKAPGYFQETPTDILPGSFKCDLPAKDGATYLGMVMQDNNTWESIGQDLSSVLYKDTAYHFNLSLAQSRKYYSFSRISGQYVNYETPVKLRIWGYNNTTQKEELLGETRRITNKKWEEYQFTFKPVYQDCAGIRLEACFAEIGDNPYNGNLLVDNCSAIVKIKN